MTHTVIELEFYDKNGDPRTEREYVTEGCDVNDILEAYERDGCTGICWSWWQ